MRTEILSSVEIAKDGELLVSLASGGRPSYQYVYRAASGVYWDNERKGFKFAAPSPYAKWFAHVVKVVRSEMDLELVLGEAVRWINVPDEVRDEILRTAI